MKSLEPLTEEEFLQELARAPERPPPGSERAMPDRLGRFKIEGRLGKGGMGVVYRALDPELGRVVALKVLAVPLRADERHRRRFFREARAAAAVRHPNLVTVHDVGVDDGCIYIAMELAPGKTLRQVMADGVSLADARRIVREIARGAAAAHSQGVVHCDLKPDNVIVASDGTLKILDFGLAKLTREEVPARDVTDSIEGHVVGTPGYMSPEQTEGRSVEATSDVFAIGAILYELITGRRAFAGETTMQVFVATNRDEPVRASSLRKGVSPAIDRVLERCLAKDPAERYPSAGELVAAIDSLEGDHRGGRLGLTVAAIAAGAAVMWGVAHRHDLSAIVAPHRSVAVAVAGAGGHGAILVGGLGEQSRDSDFEDEWRWDGSGWTEAPGTGAGARSMASAVALGGTVVLFGGDRSFTDTWLMDGHGWSSRVLTGPSPRHSAAASVVEGKLYLFGGLGNRGLEDTWEFDGQRWISLPVRGPTRRWGAAAATLHGKMVLFGGKNGGNDTPRLDDTWTWDGARWEHVDVPGPPGRSYAAMATRGDRIVLFGGGAAHGVSLDDTWEWDGASWTKRDVPGPAGRHAPCAASLGDTVLLFGGTSDDDRADAYFGDTWVWDGATWTKRDVSGPPPRAYASMVGPL